MPRSKMGSHFVLLSCIMIGLTMAQLNPSDIDKVMSSNSAFKVYFNCLIDEGGCTPKGRQLKSIIPNLIRHGCSECTAEEKKMVKMIVRRMQSERKVEWEKLRHKYDPHHEYDEVFHQFMSS
ncbi:allergen Tha p 1-like [Venturia canescens]|uniref:allergen Tha p 1-like n=1 Tax=Venturia canescens TaxID=32260 RepID=UPI001C9CF1BB|nr:allergen Tha p 1-like [Venturia canescens]